MEEIMISFEEWKERNKHSHLLALDLFRLLYEYQEEQKQKQKGQDESSVDATVKAQADALSKLKPEEYAEALLSMPHEKALSIVSVTSALFVESLAALRRKQDKGSLLVSLEQMIYSIETYELWYLKCIVDKIPISANDCSPPLIDVWQNYDTFVLQDVSKEEKNIGKIHFGEKPQREPKNPNTHSVVSEEIFRRNFAIFTDGQFEGWEEWDNMVVIGGSVVASLLPVPSSNVAKYYHEVAYATSDIDVYFYGLENSELANKITRLYEHLKKVNGGDVLVVRTHLTVTFCSAWPKRHIQIVIGDWDSIPAILFEPDIDCTCVVFNGTNLFASQRARFSFNYRAIIASNKRYATRGFPEYEKRLIKYSQRGFYIWDLNMKPDFSNISLRLLLCGKDRLLEYKKVEGRACVYGLRLLLLGYFWPKTLENAGIRFFVGNFTNHNFKDEGLPYGPKWSNEKIREHLKKPVFEDSSYGAMESTSPFQCLSDQEIQNWPGMMAPHRNALVNYKDDSYERHSFRSFIFIDQDIIELENRMKRIENCENCGYECANYYFALYPQLSSYCEGCWAGLSDQAIKMIMAPPLVPPSAYELNLARFRENPEKFEKFEEFDSSEKSSAQVDARLYSDEPKGDETPYSPKFLLSVGDSSFIEEDKYEQFMRPPKIQAVLAGDVEELKRLEKQYPYLGSMGHKGRTPLTVACEKGDIKMVKCLLELGASPEWQNSSTGWTPLLYALDKGYDEVVKLLLAHKASIQASEDAISKNINQATLPAGLKEKLAALKNK